jgi:DNA-binding transcriptional ArsR family regulator
MDDPIIYDLQAELCHSMNNPVRLQILHLLFEGSKNVGDIVLLLGLGQSSVSRHLAVLRRSGIVTAEWQGQVRWISMGRIRLTFLVVILSSIALIAQQ